MRARGARRWSGFVVLVAAVVALSGVLSGCVSAKSSSGGSGAGLTAATELSGGIAKPAVTLTDTSGATYDFTARTGGRPMLLYFGYTHCPDVCPTTMADIALALRNLPALAPRITVVFVTTDPDRDTPAVIKAWLAHFDSRFVGLTGSVKSIDAFADAVGVPIEPPVKEADGTYSVTHGAQVLVFGADNQARAAFTEGAGAAGYTHDLPILLKGDGA
jgi:protein SCO1/2